MAKNKSDFYLNSDLARRQENIRKAKGNPNKNIHHRKNGSNYGGVNRVDKREAARQTVRRRESIFDMTRTQGIVFAALLGLAVLGVILSFTVWRDADADRYLPAAVMGLPSAFLAYVGFTNRHKPRTSFQTVLLVILALCGVYALLALLALLGVLKG